MKTISFEKLFIVLLILAIIALVGDMFYRKGQLDALNGHQMFELVTNAPTSTVSVHEKQ